jgi:hypothetical protein
VELFKDIINGILYNKRELFKDPEAEKVYNPFIVNRALSYHKDTLFFANQINQLPHLDKSCQIIFFLNTIRASKRPFTKWSKPMKEGDLEAVKMYYGYSDKKALDALKLLTDEQLTEIKERINTGE